MTRIMVVDDDVEFTQLYQAVLKMVGYETVTTNVSSQALDLAKEIGPDLFILDLMMPKPDGFQLCRMIRAEKQFLYTPIIIVTALNDQDSRLVAFGAGADEYLTKPFHVDHLKKRIEFLLERMKH